MAADDLTKPLGLDKPKQRGSAVQALKFVAGGAALLVAISAIWYVLIQDPKPEPEETGVIAAIDDTPVSALAPLTSSEAIAANPNPATISVAPNYPANPATISAPANRPSGLTEIPAPDGSISELGADEIVITNPDDPAPIRLAAAPAEELLESSPHGLLPRIGSDGSRPIDAYARPTEPQASSSRAQIAIVVGGIGIAEAGTDAAIATLPGAITLAFAPYGKDLPRTLARARAAGHEILLQLPLEPYGYPNNDPGPHTLTVEASREENIDRLHFLLSRITTYVGVTNYLGARFTSEEKAIGPVIAEIGKRGLLYFDDGTSSTSRAARLARGRAPYAHADVVLDAVTEDKAIDARLAELEAIAQRNGFAIAAATAFPVSIKRIAEFAKSAAERGITIVPLTTLVDRNKR